ncbi:MAG TPA: MobQ family relaxase [Candidatus Sulfotelmatobacter sp.]|jgi:hypothetical protein|nr:MobQ family relaxase [Candidatus Sulfotelmatobacter sp.]
MAIYHFSAGVVQRSKGQSAVAAAAYRAGCRLIDARTGEIHDYRAKSHVEHTEIIAPAGAAAWVYDRTQLWSRAEMAATKSNAQTARKLDVALPRELSAEENLEAVRELARDLASQGMIVDFAIHTPDASDGEDQPHAHMLITMRPLDPSTTTGFTKKQGDGRHWTDLFSDQAAFKKDKAGKAFVSETESLNRLRKAWADNLNRRLESAGSDVRVDHKSLKDRHAEAVARGDLAAAVALDRPPEPKAGRGRSMSKRGQKSDAWDDVQEVRRLRQQAQAMAPKIARRQEKAQKVQRHREGLDQVRAQADETAKQRYKRKLLARWYEAEVAKEVESHLAWVRQREHETVVQMKSGARLRDSGETIAAQKIDPAALKLQMEMAKAKGWDSISVSGTDAYKQAAAWAATQAGLIVTNNELSGVVVEARASMAAQPEPQEEPVPEYPAGATDRERKYLDALYQTAAVNVQHGNRAYADEVMQQAQALAAQIEERQRQQEETQRQADASANQASSYQSRRLRIRG